MDATFWHSEAIVTQNIAKAMFVGVSGIIIDIRGGDGKHAKVAFKPKF
jgi:hypothetical protein